MRRRGQLTTFQERIEISDRAVAGETDPEIARALGCSVYTVRKWRRRFVKQGRAGLRSTLGRPTKGPLGSFLPNLRQTLHQWRESHPGWGPDTRLIERKRDRFWRQQTLASRTQIAAFLKEASLTRRDQRHAELPQPTPQTATRPHQEWPLDAQGAVKVEGLGKTSLINVVDVASRLKVARCPRVDTSKPAAADYYLTLRRAFLSFGLPYQLSLDHDTVFIDNTSPSPFPTRLHLWLIALGVAVIFTDKKRSAADHAQIERTHQTMAGQALEGQAWPNQATLWTGLDERRAVLNPYLPVRALDGQAPLQAYPNAVYSGRPYRPAWEESLLSLPRVYQYLAQGRVLGVNRRFPTLRGVKPRNY